MEMKTFLFTETVWVVLEDRCSHQPSPVSIPRFMQLQARSSCFLFKIIGQKRTQRKGQDFMLVWTHFTFWQHRKLLDTGEAINPTLYSEPTIHLLE